MKNLICLTTAVIFTVSCAQNEPKSDSKPTETGKAQPSAKAKATDATAQPLIIDVRSKGEWDSGHLSQAVHIPYTEIADQIAKHTTDKNRKIVLYCRSGGRAGKAQKALEDLGYKQVYVVAD